MPPRFIFATCQPEAQAALKTELAERWSEFRFAYSRPGFITFKVPEEVPLEGGFDLCSVYARSYGLSLGKAKGDNDSERLNWMAYAFREARALCLHVSGAEAVAPELVSKVATQLAALVDTKLDNSGKVPTGAVVFDVVVINDNEWWMGWHTHSVAHRPWPGGIIPIPLPPEAPSRAYLKLKETLTWPGLPVQPNDTALELGSAPGGASLALLEAGLNVIGVDPGDMSDVVTANPKFRHLHKQAQQLTSDDLKNPIQWIISDMNVEPAEVLRCLQRAIALIGPGLCGCALTIKMASWMGVEDFRDLVGRVLKMGFSEIRLTQLFHNRREACLIGLSGEGLRRLHGPLAGSVFASGGEVR